MRYSVSRVGFLDDRNRTKLSVGCDADRDFGRFKNHVDPLIGSKRIGDIEARDLLLMIRELKRQKKADGSPRHADGSIVNILGVCSSVFELAILEGAIEHNPVKHIPSRKRPKKRGRAAFRTGTMRPWR